MKARITAWLFVAAAVGLAAAALAVVLVTQRAAPQTQAEDFVTPAQARALGAQWRANRSKAAETDYARALISAGLYNELLSEIAEQGLFSDDDGASRLYKAEANLQLGRYADALADAAKDDANPYYAFVRARARYALQPDDRSIAGELAAALRGPDDLAAQAWLFRARIELDANNFDGANAAARRAEELGVAPGGAEAVRIEALIRDGDLARAAALMEMRGQGTGGPRDIEGLRLAAMYALKLGDAVTAARYAEVARASGSVDGGIIELAALAKWTANEHAQASAIIENRLSAAPNNWAALDIAAAIAADMKRPDAALEYRRRLELARPALAFVRKRRLGASHDELFTAALAFDEDPKTGGAGAKLLGIGALPPKFREADSRDLSDIALAAVIRSGDADAMRAKAGEALTAAASPLSLTLAGEAYLQSGDKDSAMRAWTRAVSASPGFYAPVVRLSELYEASGDIDFAQRALKKFLADNASHHEARLTLARLLARHQDFTGAAALYAQVPASLAFATAQSAADYGTIARKAGADATAKMIRAAKAVIEKPKVLGFALAAAGDHNGAAQALRRALIADPEDTDAASLFLETMSRLGRRAEAVSLIKEIESRRPADNSSDPAPTPENSPV
jgi:Tfp pilus assembly protein PilF